MMKQQKVKVYFAGKIRHNCWRHSIFPAITQFEEDDLQWPWVDIEGTHVTYTGPYFSAMCGHGLCHGSATHGNEDWGRRGAAWEGKVRETCLEAIDFSQEVFVWIDSLDCYATLIEVGYAFSRGKKIRVGVCGSLDLGGSDSRHELWFLENMANDFGRFPSALIAFRRFYEGAKV